MAGCDGCGLQGIVSLSHLLSVLIVVFLTAILPPLEPTTTPTPTPTMAAFRSMTALRAASGSSSMASSSLLRPSLAASHASSSSLALRAFSTSRPLPASHPAANAKQSYIQGTVNEPTTYPPPNPAHGHYHWIFERAISVALLPLTAAAVAKHGASGVLDAALGLSLVAHSHIG